MDVLRFAVVVLIAAALVYRLLKEVLIALATGKLRYGRGRGERYARRESDPYTFWSMMVLYALMSAATVGLSLYWIFAFQVANKV